MFESESWVYQKRGIPLRNLEKFRQKKFYSAEFFVAEFTKMRKFRKITLKRGIAEFFRLK